MPTLVGTRAFANVHSESSFDTTTNNFITDVGYLAKLWKA